MRFALDNFLSYPEIVDVSEEETRGVFMNYVSWGRGLSLGATVGAERNSSALLRVSVGASTFNGWWGGIIWGFIAWSGHWNGRISIAEYEKRQVSEFQSGLRCKCRFLCLKGFEQQMNVARIQKKLC